MLNEGGGSPVFLGESCFGRGDSGASKPERVREDHAALDKKVPGDFWLALRDQDLVAPNAPLPTDN